jgi:integrase
MDTDDQVITQDELVGRLLPAVPDRYRALVGLAAGTGLRWGEAVGLRWDAIDLVAQVVSVVRVAEEVSGHVRLKPYPKSLAGRRTVPLPPFVVELLRVHARDFDPGVEGLVFVAKTGEPPKRGTFRARIRMWKPSLPRARLPMTLRFHDLRHSCATWLVSDGVPINDVAKVMGHEQTSTTLNDTHTRPGIGTGGCRRRLLLSLPRDLDEVPDDDAEIDEEGE